MKKRNTIISACLLPAFVMVSCEKEADFKTASAGDDNVSVSMGVLRTDQSPIVRSAGGEETSLRYVAEIWQYDEINDEYGQSVLRVETKSDNDNSAYMKFPLKEPGKYRLLLWADYISASAEADDNGAYPDRYYDTSKGLKSVTSKYAAFNDLSSDAFYMAVDFEKKPGPVSIEGLVLSRAVAKLTVKEKKAESWQKAVSFSASYNVPATFDVETGTAFSEETVAIIDCPLAGDAAKYDYTVFFDYVLVSSGRDYTVPSIALSGKDTEDRVYEKNGIENIILRQNARTIISGSDMLVDPSGETEEPEIIYEFEGKGTPAEPFLIASAADLLKLMGLVNNGVLLPSDPAGRKYADACYMQTTAVSLTNNGEDVVERICIGTSANPFSGIYDGGGFSLTGTDGIAEKGFTVSNSTADLPYVALFGVVDGAVLRNIRGVANNQNKTSTTQSAAGICAVSRGETVIENSECLVQNITCNGISVGGICGMVENGKLTIKGCRVAPKDKSGIKGNDASNEYIGGILGFVDEGAEAEIIDSYNTAKIVQTPDEADCMGGICGGNKGILLVRNCYSTSSFGYATNDLDVTTTKALSAYIVGGDAASISGVNVENCFYVKPGGKKAQAKSDNGAKVMNDKNWPAWDVATTLWGSLGAYSADTPVYPSLEWE